MLLCWQSLFVIHMISIHPQNLLESVGESHWCHWNIGGTLERNTVSNQGQEPDQSGHLKMHDNLIVMKYYNVRDMYRLSKCSPRNVFPHRL